jgi:hypothetical protein
MGTISIFLSPFRSQFMTTPDTPSHTIARTPKAPPIQFTKKDGSAVEQRVRNPPVSPPPAPPPKTQPSVEHRKKPTALDVLNDWSQAEIEKILEIYKDRPDETTQNERRSRGYITLVNLYQEMQTGSTAGRQSGSRHAPYPRGRSAATLLESHSGSFFGTAALKTAGEWDARSYEAFELNATRAFNSLTKDKLTDVIARITAAIHDNPSEEVKRRDFVFTQLVRKAEQEASYAQLHAQFVVNCTEPGLQEAIVREANRRFEDAVLNPGSSEAGFELCAGSARFLGALAALEGEDSPTSPLEPLFKKLQSGVHVPFVEMTKAFVEMAGQRFARTVDPRRWRLLEDLSGLPELDSRLRFMVRDVLELRDHWVLGLSLKRARVAAVVSSDAHLAALRSALVDFGEDDSRFPEVKLTGEELLRAAMRLLPDQGKEGQFFAYFVCQALTRRNYRVETPVAVAIVREGVRGYVAEQMDHDTRGLWQMMSMLVAEMMLRSVISLEQAKTIHIEFPDHNADWDPQNDLKWYIDDFHYFDSAVRSSGPGQFPREIYDALQLPDMVDHRPAHALRGRVTRLIAVGIVRSVFVLFRANRGERVADFGKWKDWLKLAIVNQGKAAQAAAQAEIESSEFAFSYQDLEQYVAT